MNKNIVVTTILVCLIYSASYLVFPYFFHTSHSEELRSFTIYPTCEQGDMALLLLDSTESICLSETRLYARSYGKSFKLREREKDTQYFPSSHNLLISLNKELLRIERITPTKDILAVHTVPMKLRLPISLFFSKDSMGQLLVFLSVQTPAITEQDTKSKHYKITLSGESTYTVSISEFSTIEMLRVANYHSKDNIAVMREMYPFLQEKTRIIVWKESPKILTNGPDYDKLVDLVTSTDQEPSVSSELLGKYSTTIRKRVYNCFDFSESSQITLRSCKPEL